MGKPIPLCALLCLLLFPCGQLILNMTTVEATSNVHIVYLGETQHDDPMLTTNSHHDMLASVVGSKEIASELMVYSYKHGFSGFAAKFTESQAQKVAELPGVVRVIPNSLHRIQTTRSWDFLGLSAHSPVNTLHNSSMGDGVIIGVLDTEVSNLLRTGIWPEAKSFSDKGLGPIPSHWKGVCESGKRFKAKRHCNRKIIGARWFVEGLVAEYGQPLNISGNREFFSPRDANGHGTHTASTAAGAFVHNVSYRGLGHGTIRGGAPRARLAIYKVCWNVLGGQCSSADILKAFDEAIHDGVDVLSLSIDIDERDGIATGSFHAVAKGITVVCGAANDGPFAQTVQNSAPWILTVAATSMDRAFPTPITLGNNKSFLGQAIYTGKEIGFSSLIYPETKGLNPNSAGVCQSLSVDNSMVAGKVVLCFTTMNLGAVRSAAEVVKEAGGVGLIVAKNPGEALYPCTDGFPCVEVDYEIGTQILFYIRSTRMVVMPCIQEHQWQLLMSQDESALLKAMHPDWSPAAIKSAIVTTAWRNNPSGFPVFAEGSPQKLADPFDYGGGITNPNGAAQPGLVYDMATDDYVSYLCSMDYNNTAISWLTGNPTVCPTEEPSILNINLPSITIPNLRNSTTLTRTVTNVGASTSIYRAVIEPPFGTSVSVKPNVLVFDRKTKKLTFSVTVNAAHQRTICALVSLLFLVYGHGSMMTKVEATSKVHIVYLGEKQHDDPILTTNSHHDMLASVVESKEMASELMVHSYKHGFSGFAAKLTESQEYGPSLNLSVMKDLDQSHHVGKVFVNLGSDLSLESIVTGKSLEPVDYDQPLNTSANQEFLSPRDANGHGTHTASTAAGGFVENVSYKGPGLGTVRGGAPRARLAIYKVCWNVLGGWCSAADVLKAFDEAIHDGVDVLSLSLGYPPPLFSDTDERDGIAIGSFHAVTKGITVVCSAGNAGPSSQTVLNTSPWILNVAASTIDRAFLTPITLGNNKTFLGEATFAGKEIGFRSLIYPEAKGLDPNSAGVCQSLSVNPSMVSGKVVLCFTSMTLSAVISAAEVVKEAGGVGFPIVKLSASKTIVGKPVSAKVAFFSSRGPNAKAPAILKPDIAAPGVSILAATSPLDRFQDDGYVMYSGTSMAAPHVAGIVALLKTIHPDWSPAAFRSALVTTAWRNHPSGFPIFAEGSPRKLANPFDFGGGIANPNGAADPGLVYDMGTADYINYLCAMDYNNTAISRLTGNPTVCPTEEPSILNINLPSITIPNLRNSTTLTRTVTNVGASTSIYRAVIEPPLVTSVSVKPNVLVFNRKTKKLTFSVTVTTAHQSS
uniref:Uncharacterized protein n=1 Tax=Salix viminalis TaxID=40686 RepID=A0A6N2N4F0_SALVM